MAYSYTPSLEEEYNILGGNQFPNYISPENMHPEALRAWNSGQPGFDQLQRARAQYPQGYLGNLPPQQLQPPPPQIGSLPPPVPTTSATTESEAARQRRLHEFIFRGSLGMMARAGQPGATGLGAFGQGFGKTAEEMRKEEIARQTATTAAGFKERELGLKGQDLAYRQNLLRHQLKWKGTSLERERDRRIAVAGGNPIKIKAAHDWFGREVVKRPGATTINLGDRKSLEFQKLYGKINVDAIVLGRDAPYVLNNSLKARSDVINYRVLPGAFAGTMAHLTSYAKRFGIDLNTVLDKIPALKGLKIGNLSDVQNVRAIGKEMVLTRLESIKGSASNRDLDQAIQASIDLGLEPEALLEILNRADEKSLKNLDRAIGILRSKLKTKDPTLTMDYNDLVAQRKEWKDKKDALGTYKRQKGEWRMPPLALAKSLAAKPPGVKITLNEAKQILQNEDARQWLNKSGLKGIQLIETMRRKVEEALKARAKVK
jgi:hypothetical protein